MGSIFCIIKLYNETKIGGVSVLFWRKFIPRSDCTVFVQFRSLSSSFDSFFPLISPDLTSSSRRPAIPSLRCVRFTRRSTSSGRRTVRNRFTPKPGWFFLHSFEESESGRGFSFWLLKVWTCCHSSVNMALFWCSRNLINNTFQFSSSFLFFYWRFLVRNGLCNLLKNFRGDVNFSLWPYMGCYLFVDFFDRSVAIVVLVRFSLLVLVKCFFFADFLPGGFCVLCYRSLIWSYFWLYDLCVYWSFNLYALSPFSFRWERLIVRSRLLSSSSSCFWMKVVRPFCSLCHVLMDFKQELMSSSMNSFFTYFFSTYK